MAMLTEAYIEALLINEELADQVWEVWAAGIVTNEVEAWAWWSIVRKTVVKESKL